MDTSPLDDDDDDDDDDESPTERHLWPERGHPDRPHVMIGVLVTFVAPLLLMAWFFIAWLV